jgi:anti-sigma B factor antagonist
MRAGFDPDGSLSPDRVIDARRLRPDGFISNLDPTLVRPVQTGAGSARSVAMDGDFETRLINPDGDAVLVASGEIDAATSPMLHEACLQLASVTDRLVLDFSAVTFMDSSALRVLIEMHLREGTSGVVIRNPSEQVRRLLQMTGLASQFLERTEMPHAADATTQQRVEAGEK